MSELFNVESAFYRIMTRVWNIMVLGILWDICSIPIITAGASTAALNTVMLKLVRDEEGYIVRSFFRAFASNFRQATVLWAAILAGMLTAGFDILFFVRMGGTAGILLAGIFVAVLLTEGLTLVVMFHYQAWFENPVKRTLLNSLKVALGYMPYSVGLLILMLVMGYGIYCSVPVMMFLSVFGMGIFAFASAYLWRRIFDKITQDSDKNQ